MFICQLRITRLCAFKTLFKQDGVFSRFRQQVIVSVYKQFIVWMLFKYVIRNADLSVNRQINLNIC